MSNRPSECNFDPACMALCLLLMCGVGGIAIETRTDPMQVPVPSHTQRVPPAKPDSSHCKLLQHQPHNIERTSSWIVSASTGIHLHAMSMLHLHVRPLGVKQHPVNTAVQPPVCTYQPHNIALLVNCTSMCICERSSPTTCTVPTTTVSMAAVQQYAQSACMLHLKGINRNSICPHQYHSHCGGQLVATHTAHLQMPATCGCGATCAALMGMCSHT